MTEHTDQIADLHDAQSQVLEKIEDVLEQEIEIAHTEEQILQDVQRISQILRSVGFHRFMHYLESPRKIFWRNLLAGIAYGMGWLIALTVVLGIVIWFLEQLIPFPVIGQYFETLKNLLESYSPPTSSVISQ